MELRDSPRQNLAPLLNARSVAIVGASELPRFGGWVYKNLAGAGYPGSVYAVNPRYTTLFDRPCFASLRDLPDRPDLAVLAVPNDRLERALQDVAELGIPAAVIFASAYSEPVEGRMPLQARLAEIARDNGIALCGPNCMGFLAPGQRLVISGYAITPGLPAGNVTFVTHSGTVFDTLWQNRHGVYFNYLVSAGNEIATTLADYLQFALADPSTRAVGLLMETVRDPQALRLALALAAERDIPVVALKVGRSARGAELAQAHSGALAGQDAVYEALFAYYGVRRVISLDEMLDSLELFAVGLRPPTRAIASIHDSGGERGLLVDLAEAEGVPFAAIQPATVARLAAALEPGLAPVNPLDAWGTGNDFGRIYHDCLLALDADPATGLNVWVADLYPAGALTAAYLETASALKPRLTKPLVFLPTVSSSVSPEFAERARALGFPVLMGTENGLRAIRHLLDYAEARRAPVACALVPMAPPAGLDDLRRKLEVAPGPLDESASRLFLQAYGIPFPAGAVVSSSAEALAAAARIGYPVVAKATGQPHKSDQGGVRLDIRDADALSRAYADLAARFGPRVLVQKMAAAGLELILGIVNDPQFGPLLAVGMGGIFVEVLKDSRLLLLPATRAEVRQALLGLRGAPLLQGARGRPPVDLDAVVDVAMRLSALAGHLGDLIAAVDINPLIAGPEGALAVDALIIPKPPSRPRWAPGAEVGRPLALCECAVDPGWIDYNGHMTEASYLTVFGNASDALFRYVGIDEAYRAGGHSFYTVETHINYYQEAKTGEPLRVTTQLLGLDEKRLHLFHAMTRGGSGELLATTEQMLVHVDMKASAAAPILPGVYAALSAILAAHQSLPAPKQVGRPMAITRQA